MRSSLFFSSAKLWTPRQIMKKLCNSCKVEKPLDHFSPCKRGLHGRHSSCRACRNQSQRRRKRMPPPATIPDGKRRGMTREEFAATNDFSTRTRLAIRRTVKTLRADEILKDAEFRSECAWGPGAAGGK